MSRKRLRTSSESTCSQLGSVFKIEKAPKPVIKGKKVSTLDDEKVYLESEPPGKDTKDTVLSNLALTNLICPKWTYKIQHYGFNFGGEHRFKTADIEGGGGIDTGTNDANTDSIRFVLDSGYGIASQCDTIAWTAGSQAWYESLSLPGTWKTSSTNAETIMKEQPSMVGMINAAKFGLRHMTDSTLLTQPDPKYDFTVCYRGGHQLHTFVNQNEHEIYYELWELIPRDIIYDWMDSIGDGLSYATRFGNIHSQVTYAYNQNGPGTSVAHTSSDSAVNYRGVWDGSTTYTSSGQRILHKNDPGFRINSNCLDLYHKFRVSKPQRGSLKSGSVLRYKLKHGPFNVRNSVWNRWVEGVRPSNVDPEGDSDVQVFDQFKFGHLVPCASKILCVRFWSEIGNKPTFNSAETTSQMKFDYAAVTNVQGRVLHTVDEYHSIRCVPYVKNNQYIEKNFRLHSYDATSASSANDWRVINDEQNSQQTTLETN